GTGSWDFGNLGLSGFGYACQTGFPGQRSVLELSCSGAVFGKCRSHGPFRRPGISRGSLAEKRKKIISYEECIVMKEARIAAMLLVTFTALSSGACGEQSAGQGNSSEATPSGDPGQEQS